MNVHARWAVGLPPRNPAERMYATACAELATAVAGSAYWYDVIAWALAAEGAGVLWIRYHWRQACALRGYCPI